jgi:diamine N-acetyltransferase
LLIGTHIFLRAIQPSDVDFILALENNPENWEVSGTTTPFTREEITSFVNAEHDIYKNKQYRFIICLSANNQSIGTIDLFEFDEQLKQVGIGILIGEKEDRNKGYASEALKLVINYCATELKIVQLFCNIFKENKNSIRLFEKNGFQFIEERALFGKPVNYYELLIPPLKGGRGMRKCLKK